MKKYKIKTRVYGGLKVYIIWNARRALADLQRGDS